MTAILDLWLTESLTWVVFASDMYILIPFPYLLLICICIPFILLHNLISFFSIVKTNGSCDGNVVLNGEVDGIRNRAKKES